MGDLKAFTEWLSGEIGVLGHVSTWVVIGVAAFAIWRAMEWRYGGQISRLTDKVAELTESQKPVTIRIQREPSEGVLKSLGNARGGAVVAIAQGNDRTRAKAYHELDAVVLTVEKAFGVAPLKLPREIADHTPFKIVLEAYVEYIDRFYPLLREGHIEQAREKAAGFKTSWGAEGA